MERSIRPSTGEWAATEHGLVRPAVYERAYEARYQREHCAERRNLAAWVPVRAPAEDRWPLWAQALIFWGGLAVIGGLVVTSLVTGWFHFGLLSAGVLRLVLKFS